MEEEEEKVVPQNTAQQYTDKFLKDYTPAPDDTYVSRFSSMYPEPKPYTPKQEQLTRNSASMAETLKSLAEIYGQSKGAFLKQRQPEENVKADATILREKNKYDTDLREYARAMIQAGGQDSEKAQQLKLKADAWGQALSDKDENRKLQANKIATEQKRYDETISYRDKKDIAEEKQRGVQNGIGWYNAQTSRINALRPRTGRTTSISSRYGYATDKYEDGKETVPVMVGGKQYDFPAENVDMVVAAAIRNGVAGTYEKNYGGVRGILDEPITATTKLDGKQRKAIFDSVAGQFISIGNGKFTIRKNLSDYDKAKNTEAYDKEYRSKPTQTQNIQESTKLKKVEW